MRYDDQLKFRLCRGNLIKRFFLSQVKLDKTSLKSKDTGEAVVQKLKSQRFYFACFSLKTQSDKLIEQSNVYNWRN